MVGEHVVGVGVEHEPHAGVDLAVELGGAPSGIAAEHAHRAHGTGDERRVGGEVGRCDAAGDRGELVGGVDDGSVGEGERDERVGFDRTTFEHELRHRLQIGHRSSGSPSSSSDGRLSTTPSAPSTWCSST